MVITVTCPSCSSAFPVDPAKIPVGGVNARCSSCGDIFRVEKPADPPPVPTLEEMAPVAEPAVAAPEAPVSEPAEAVSEAAVEPAPPVEAAPAVEPTPPVEPVADDPPFGSAEAPSVEADPLPGFSDPAPEAAEAEPEPAVAEPEPTPAADPFSEAAPFESTEDASPAEAPAPSGGGVQGFTFGKRDPTDKAKRLARVLVSDMIMYNAERHQSALSAGTLVQDFEEEIDKSWKEYVEQVGDELAGGAGRGFWTEALNDILAKGEQVF